MIDLESAAQVAVGGALVGYGLWEGWKRLPKVSLPSIGKVAGTSDMHTVLDIAERLKAAGHGKAVELCKELIDEMLAVKG